MGRMNRVAVRDAGEGLLSERLLLRRFTLADLPLLTVLNADPVVMRYLGGVETPEQTLAMLRGRILDYYQANPGLGVWATLLRAGGECIGFHLLNHIQGESLIQVGYRLFPRYWGYGYATEMSVALLLKAGLKRHGERSFAHPAYAPYGPLAWFERTAQDWLTEHQANEL